MKRKLSIISPCFNESENVEEIYARVSSLWAIADQYDYEYVFIDNASTDDTVQKLKNICKRDNRVKVIVNTRNFGHLRSPYWGVLQTTGDATIYLASDLQDPPELILDFISEWEKGWKVVLATKPISATNGLFHHLRKAYYRALNKISDIDLVNDATGFGLYDKAVLNLIRTIDDPYPYFRGLVAELGYPIKCLEFKQPRRLRGVSKNNFYTLYDYAMLGIVSHSRFPLRLASFVGFILGAVSFFVAMIFLVAKCLFWNSIPMGIAPLGIGMFFMFGILLFFIGMLGEYIGSIHTYVQRRPVVVEKERINFD